MRVLLIAIAAILLGNPSASADQYADSLRSVAVYVPMAERVSVDTLSFRVAIGSRGEFVSAELMSPPSRYVDRCLAALSTWKFGPPARGRSLVDVRFRIETVVRCLPFEWPYDGSFYSHE